MSDWSVVCDFLFHHGGAERVVSEVAGHVLGQAPVAYLEGAPDTVETVTGGGPARRLLPRGVVTADNYRLFAPLYPAYLRSLPVLQGNALVSSYAFAHHVPVAGRKVVYCHTPLRQVWSGAADYARAQTRTGRHLAPPVHRYLRRADLAAARTADQYIATSTAVKARIERYYDRSDVPIIPPPVDVERYAFREWTAPADRDGYYLFVGRLVEPYKRVRLAVEAFRAMPDLRLVVAGDGRDRRELEAAAGPGTTFLGWQGTDQLARLYAGARGVVFPSTDDFGIVPIEATASGTPVVCYAEGGVVDTVLPDVTGTMFTEPTTASLVAAVRRAEATCWSPEAFRAQAATFAAPVFRRRLADVLGL